MPSTYHDILEAVKAAVEAVDGAPPVALRYDLNSPEGDKPPLVLVAPSVNAVKVKKQLFGAPGTGGTVWYQYPVHVLLLTAGNRGLSAGLADHLALWQGVRDALFRVRLAGAEAVFDTDLTAEAVSKFAALVGTNYRVGGWVMWYTVAEQRAA